MNEENCGHIVLVDDEPNARKVIAETLEQFNFKVTCFACASDWIRYLNNGSSDLLVTDLRLPDMDGIELLKHTKSVEASMPVLITSGHGDIPTAVECIKAGAVDFIEKPLEKHNFVQKVRSILQSTGNHYEIIPDELTRAEVRVLNLVLDGHSSKDIAQLLKRSRRTIEVHRANVMHKLKADNLIELIKRGFELGLVKTSVEYRTGGRTR